MARAALTSATLLACAATSALAVGRVSTQRMASRPAHWTSHDNNGEFDNVKSPNKQGAGMDHIHGILEPRVQKIDMATRPGAPDGLQTYRVYLECDPRFTHNIHAIFGDKQMALKISTDDGSDFYHVPAPFGVDVGGVPDALIKVKPEAAVDTWLTVNINEGKSREKLSLIGLQLSPGAPGVLAESTNGVLFLMDPTSDLIKMQGKDIPTPSRPGDVVVLIAQLTVNKGTTFTGHINVQGSFIGKKERPKDKVRKEEGAPDTGNKQSWQEHGICFSNGEAGCSMHVAPAPDYTHDEV